MFEIGSIGSNKMDAAAALRQPLLPPIVKPPSTVKNMIRLLTRSHSAHGTASVPMEKFLIPPIQINPHHHDPHNLHLHEGPQYIANDNLAEPRIVNFIEGLPFVMGSKKKMVSC